MRKRPEGYVILGAGGLARELYWNIVAVHPQSEIVFVDDMTQKSSIEVAGKEFKLVNDWDFSQFKNFEFIVGVGNPQVKEILVKKALSCDMKPAESIVHPNAIVQDAKLGFGGFICAGCILTTNIKINDYVVINLNSTVGHDTVIDSFTQINPGCQISGNVTIGPRVSLGTGATIIEKISICSDVIIGAQATVVQNINEPGTFVGTPAKLIKSKN